MGNTSCRQTSYLSLVLPDFGDLLPLALHLEDQVVQFPLQVISHPQVFSFVDLTHKLLVLTATTTCATVSCARGSTNQQHGKNKNSNEILSVDHFYSEECKNLPVKKNTFMEFRRKLYKPRSNQGIELIMYNILIN